MNSIPTIPPVQQGKRSPDTKTVLLVEDFIPLNDLVARYLASCGYRVLIAHNAFEARRVAEAREHIDLLLTDLNMPGLRGDELAGWFATEHPEARIVLMSYQPVMIPAVRDIGFLQKPFTLNELGAAVRIALAPLGAESARGEGASIAA